MELDGADEIKYGVMAGLGLMVWDVENFPLMQRWYAAHRQGKRLSLAAQTFLEYLQQKGEQEIQHLLTHDLSILTDNPDV